MNATHHDDIRIGFCGLLGQRQGVANEIGNVLYLTLSVVMCQDDGIFLLAHFSYLFL